jgi:hypothetical protein
MPTTTTDWGQGNQVHSPKYKIGYRLLDIEDYDDYTLTLIP